MCRMSSLRCDANVSLRPVSTTPLGIRTETKNVNSLRSVERAVRYEITRQAAILAKGGRVTQETRHGMSSASRHGRNKETSEDYRYFPSPIWCRWRRVGNGSNTRHLAEPPAAKLRRVTAEWGFTDLEMRDVISAGAVNAIEATVAVGVAAVGPEMVAY